MAGADGDLPQLDMSTAITDSNHGIIVTVVAWICFVASLIFFAARMRIRWPLKSLFGQDDAACTAAMASAVVQTALVLTSVDRGFGTRQDELSTKQVEDVSKVIWTSDLFYVVSLALSKLAIACLFRRFSAAAERIRIFKTFMAAVGVYGVVGLLITALRQDILHPWRYNEDTAQSNFHRWAAFGAMGILLDLVALIAPFYLIWDIQMDRRSKMRVVVAFAIRAPIVVFTILRLVTINNLTGVDFTYAYVTPEVYTQLELHFSLIGATIPCLRIFLKAWNTSFLAMGLEDIDDQAYVQHTIAKGTYAMGSVGNSKGNSSGQGGSNGRGNARSGLRSGNGPWASKKGYGVSQATVGGGREDGDAASENSQKAIVVKQTVDVNVG